MIYGSVCSGIEAATAAWHELGWRPAFLSEIEAFPRAVLAERVGAVCARQSEAARRGVALWGDFTALRVRHMRRLGITLPDLLVGGTPCQAFSVAGLRRSLADDRGNLTLQYVRLANAIEHARRALGLPGLDILWENVPGVLSTKDNAFGCFLGALVGADAPLVPGRGQRWTNAGLVVGPRRTAAWCLRDAQYFGLAQRRERVFVVASPGDGIDPAAVLFEPEGVRRHSPPSREAGAQPAGTLKAGAGGGCGPDDGSARAGHLIAATLAGGGRTRGGFSYDDIPLAFGGNNTAGAIDVATALNTCPSASGRMDFESETFVVHGSQDPNVMRDLAHALGRNNGLENAVCVTGAITHALKAEGADGSEDGTGRGAPIVADQQRGVRRLMPIECERLQGFPDGWTQIAWRGRPPEECPDGPRYRALGNSMAVPVMRWLGRRIEAARRAAA